MVDNSFSDLEPNIRKAKFIVSANRIYTLEFDHNIQMKELKTMIQVAAHLKKNNFKLFCESQEYTQCNEETFNELFPEQKLIVFTLERGEGEVFDEAELLLQINSPCPEHNEKFLLFYCFKCGCSVCSECFTNGTHKGHKVQDKCYFLLPSKFLVDKMFESWSRNPYDEYQISTDLQDLKKRLNDVLFSQLFNMLREIQGKCNKVVDYYNQVNENSLRNLRDSVRDIKVSCVKVLDDLKDKYNIKDIVNNTQIFVSLQNAYNEIQIEQNEKFRLNLKVFQELNQKVSELVTRLINSIYETILGVLKQALNDQQYETVQLQIAQKSIKPVDQKAIIQQYSGKKPSLGSNNPPRYSTAF